MTPTPSFQAGKTPSALPSAKSATTAAREVVARPETTHPKFLRWKPMDVAFADNIRNPRRLIVEVKPKYPNLCYTVISQDGYGCGSLSDYALMTLEEWLVWIERFRDELTGKEIREAIEAAKAPFTESKRWGEFRERFRLTGNAFTDWS